MLAIVLVVGGYIAFVLYVRHECKKRKRKEAKMMAEYIERQALIKAYVDLCLARSRLAKSRKGAAFFQGDLLPETELTDKEWMRLINAAPTVDAVKVVRCKDCIGWTTWLKTKEPSVSVCGLSGLYVGNHRDDLFCPYGERREDDG